MSLNHDQGQIFIIQAITIEMIMQAFEVTEGLTDYYQQEYPNYSNVHISEVVRKTEGWETIVYSYRLRYENEGEKFSKQLIIRLYPGKDGQQKAIREFNLMASLMLTTIQIPDPYRLEKSSTLGLPFIIMENISGTLLSERILENQKNMEKYITKFTRNLVDIHTVDWETVILESDNYKLASTPYEHLALVLNQMKDLIEIHSKPEFIPVLRWLVERMDTVPNNQLSLIHGDYHLANIMIERETDEMYVIDWINATIGDFRVDLAWTLILHETNLGKPVRDQILLAYRSFAPYEVTDIKYFEVLAILRQLMDLSINFSFGNEIARLNPSKVDQLRDNLEPIKRSLGILYGHTRIKLPEFERML